MQARKYDLRLKQQTEEWMVQFDTYATHACTFTLQQTATDVELTAEMVWDYWENYCKYLNRTIYGHSAKRHNKSLLILPILHGEISGTRLHFHAAIGCVDKEFSFDKLKAIINSTWRDMRWTMHVTEINPYRDAGWINYMLHESVRMDLHSVDIARCFIPPILKAEILG